METENKEKCENCGKEPKQDGLPYCEQCVMKISYWGDRKEKARLYYYINKDKRKAKSDEYRKNNQEKINQYYREKRKKAKQLQEEVVLLRKRVSELEQKLQQLTVDKNNI